MKLIYRLGNNIKYLKEQYLEGEFDRPTYKEIIRNYINSELFTIDTREMINREYEVAQRWLGSDYKAFTNFEVDCERDVKKFDKYIYEKSKSI